jgi:hypothetical protein
MYDVEAALQGLGIDYTVNGREAQSLCPMHYKRTNKYDNSPSWWINLDTGVHMCFSCHYKGNLLHLTCDVKELYITAWGSDLQDYDYQAARLWLASIAEVSIEQLAEQMASLPSYIHALPKPLEMSEARLAVFDTPPAEQLAKRNLSEKSAMTYGVLWDSKESRWILPLREPHFNTLYGWQEKGIGADRYFRNRPAGLQKSKTLFGIGNQNESLVIVVESPLDCLRLDSVGYSGAVAICGSSISEDQVKLLRYSKKIIFALDNDAAGYKGSKEMLTWGRKYGLNLFYFNYGGSGKKDPGDMTSEEIRWGIENAQSALFGEAAYVQRNPETISG